MKQLTINQLNAATKCNWIIIPQVNSTSNILEGYLFTNISIFGKSIMLYATDLQNFNTDDVATIIQYYADNFDIQDYAENYGEKEATEFDLLDAENVQQMIFELAAILKNII